MLWYFVYLMSVIFISYWLCTWPSNELPSQRILMCVCVCVGGDDIEDMPNPCYRKQPPLLNLMFTIAPPLPYCSLPGYLWRSRLNNAFFVSFLIKRCQIFKFRPQLPDCWVTDEWRKCTVPLHLNNNCC